MTETYDAIVTGAGTAGIPTAVCAAERGARVLLVEQADDVGGTLHVSSGQMSAAGTKLQKAKGIEDTPSQHFDDVVRIARGRVDRSLLRLAVDMAASTVDWLTDLGARFDPASPAIFYGHEPYSVPRTHWGIDGARSYLEVLRPLLDRAVASGHVDLRLGSEMTRLITDPSGAVTGIEVRRGDGPPHPMSARNVVLTTGGYGSNGELFARLTGGRPLHTMTCATSLGTGIVAAEAAGAAISGQDRFLPTFGGIDGAQTPGRTALSASLNLTPQERKPWEIFVASNGERFVAEDHPSVDAREHALLDRPDLTFWVIYDERIRREAPPLHRTWSEAKMAAAFDDHPSYVRADSVAELADRCGLPAVSLANTVATYNASAQSGTDGLGRTHMPVPLAEPPYYAIRNHGTVVRTVAGININTRLQVLDAGGRAIPNLFAAGETIGAARLSGQSFAGGMSITPALGFGRLLGRKLLRWDGVAAAAAE